MNVARYGCARDPTLLKQRHSNAKVESDFVRSLIPVRPHRNFVPLAQSAKQLVQIMQYSTQHPGKGKPAYPMHNSRKGKTKGEPPVVRDGRHKARQLQVHPRQRDRVLQEVGHVLGALQRRDRQGGPKPAPLESPEGTGLRRASAVG